MSLETLKNHIYKCKTHSSLYISLFNYKYSYTYTYIIGIVLVFLLKFIRSSL